MKILSNFTDSGKRSVGICESIFGVVVAISTCSWSIGYQALIDILPGAINGSLAPCSWNRDSWNVSKLSQCHESLTHEN